MPCIDSLLLFQACQLPLMEYLAERMCSLCYERAWYAKLGGCIAIKFLVERMAMRWVHEHLFLFLTALLFVMMDLTGEVCLSLYLLLEQN
jgi:transformation/transcription domain-associated protein